MSEGPNFERLRRAFLLQGEPDRVPLIELDAHRQLKSAFLGKPCQGLDAEIEFWTKAGYDSMCVLMGLGSIMLFDLKRRGKAQSIGREITQSRKAKYGREDEETERFWIQEGKGIIASEEDFEGFDWPEPEDLDYTILGAINKRLPQGMKTIPTSLGIFTPVYMLMGAENLFLSLYEQPDLVGRMFERVGHIEYESLKTIINEHDVGAIWVEDDIAYTEGLLVSPKHLRKYVFPWFKRVGELCRARGVPYIYHSDGRLYEVMDDIIACGFNALHPIEPKAMDMAYMKQTYGKKLCLMGNIDLAYTLTLGKPEEVAAETRQRLREAGPGGGYVVSSSNSLTEYVPLENFKAMRETVLENGRYPIRG